MARTRKGRRSYGAGEWGRNQVRVFPDPKTALFQVEWRENRRGLSLPCDMETYLPLDKTGRTKRGHARLPWKGDVPVG